MQLKYSKRCASIIVAFDLQEEILEAGEIAEEAVVEDSETTGEGKNMKK